MKTILTISIILLSFWSYSQNFLGYKKTEIINYLTKIGENPKLKATEPDNHGNNFIYFGCRTGELNL